MTDPQIFAVVILTAAALFGLLREAWRAGWLPVQCVLCHRLGQYRHSRNVMLTLGVWVRLCARCWHEQYPGG